MSTSDIGFLDADDDERYPVSSSDGHASAYSLSEEARSVYSARAASVYQTPDTRSATSHIAHDAKLKLIRVSPMGRRCIITNEATPEAGIEAAHFLPRSTKGDLLTKLEFSFGLKYRQMHIDTTRNLGYFRVDQHRSFDSGGLLCLPERDVIQKIQNFTTNREGKTYKQHLTRSKFKYRLVPLQLIKDGHGVFQRRLSDENLSYDRIFPLAPGASLPVIESHASPFFVIANAGPKLAKHYSALPDLVTSDPDLVGDINSVAALWLQWSTVEVPNTWKEDPYPRRRGGSGRGTRTGSSAVGRDASPSAGRRGGSNRSGGSAGRSGGGAGRSGGSAGRFGQTRTAGDLPELQPDDHSDSVESETLTEDAVQSVASLDRTAFLEKWLREDYTGANIPDIEI